MCESYSVTKVKIENGNNSKIRLGKKKTEKRG